MSVRKKALIALFVVFINFIGLVGLITSDNHGQWRAWLAFAAILCAGLYTRTLKCPHCDHPIFKKHVQLFGERFNYWGGLIPKGCPQCRKKL